MDYLKGLFWGLLACALLYLFAGCSKKIYVPIERVSHDTTLLYKVQRDSVYIHDSSLVVVHDTGDTVYRDKVVMRYVYRYKNRTDTVLAVRNDTISIPVATVRELGWWERTRLWLFVPLATVALGLSFIVAWLAKRIQRK